MGVNSRLSKAAGVRQSAVLMGSQANKALAGRHRHPRPGASTRPAPTTSSSPWSPTTTQAVDAALEGVDAALLAVETGTTRSEVHTLEDGLRLQPGANLAVLTIPGEYVYPEARQALEAGLHLFIFSSNVPLEQERELKRLAAGRGLLVMGPDCGTSIVGGVGIGFANAVRRGAIGVIGPAGTGLQEFTCQVHHAGGGISHAIGTGSHDLSDDIGGATTLAALEALERDPSTEVIAIVAKPGGPSATLPRRSSPSSQTGRRPDTRGPHLPPAGQQQAGVACLLGMTDREPGPGLDWSATIDAAALTAVERCRMSGTADRRPP